MAVPTSSSLIQLYHSTGEGLSELDLSRKGGPDPVCSPLEALWRDTGQKSKKMPAPQDQSLMNITGA